MVYSSFEQEKLTTPYQTRIVKLQSVETVIAVEMIFEIDASW